MRNSSKDLSIFDFKSDEANQAGDKLTKYQILKAFTSGYHHVKQPHISDLPLSDLHEVESPERSTPDRNVASIEEKFELDDVKACSTSYDKHTEVCNSDFRHGSLVQEGLVIDDSTILVASVYADEDSELQSYEIPVNSVSGEEESCTSVSEASLTSGDFSESEGCPEGPALELCDLSCEKMDDSNYEVVVCPDYVNYRGTLFLESQLTFCTDCIKIECSDANGTDEKLILVCDIEDIIRINYQWSRSVEALLLKFWIRTNVGHDVEKFIASITDVCWLEKEQKIKSLAERYEDIWDTLLDNSYTLEDEMFRTHMSFSKRHFSENMEPFEDIIYPKGDPDAVSISKRDIELLEPDTFINDTIIDFYIKYLQDKVKPNQKKRFHFFNSFFFRKLSDLGKDPGSISEGRAAFQRVRKWTRKLNIFEKDYLFIPVNFNLHWSLLVICHPGEIITFKDDDLMNSLKVPCILHMDSIKGSHNCLKNLIQSYLLEEWKGRHPELPDDFASRFSSLRFVSLELPQQENSSDCGLFLLHYVELFLEEAPVCFNPARITKLSNFLSADWFPPAEASFKRFHIRGLLYDLLQDSSQKLAPTCSIGNFPCCSDDGDQAVEFFSTENSPSNIVNGSSSTPICATQNDEFVPSPTACIMGDLGDANADTIEHLDDKANEDSSEPLVVAISNQESFQPPIHIPSSKLCSTSYCVNEAVSCELKHISETTKDEVVVASSSTSNDLAMSNEIVDSQKLTSVVVGCAFVPDSPLAYDEKLKECVNDSQEIDAYQVHDDPRGTCTVVHERNGGYYKSLEVDLQKTEHCSENIQTLGTGRKVEGDSIMAENFDGGDREMSACKKDDVIDSRESNSQEVSKECFNAFNEDLSQDSVLVEVISLDNDAIHPKRNRSTGSVTQASKRQKAVLPAIRRRVTRSTSKECSS